MSVLTEVRFGLLDAGEDLGEESLVFGLLAVLQNHRQVGQGNQAGQAAACSAAREGSGGRLDGFMAELICRLLAPLQQLIVFHLDSTHIFKGSTYILF